MYQQEMLYALLRRNKLRLTKARKAFVAILCANSFPLSVADILLSLHAAGIMVNKTTVYRELERFQKLGIVDSEQLDNRKRYYELSSRGHHHHLVCVGCDHVEDIAVDESILLREEHKVRREKKFTALRHSLKFFGLCQKCQTTG